MALLAGHSSAKEEEYTTVVRKDAIGPDCEDRLTPG